MPVARPHTLHIRLSDDERKRLGTLAKEQGVSMSRVFRGLLHKRFVQLPLPLSGLGNIDAPANSEGQ